MQLFVVPAGNLKCLLIMPTKHKCVLHCPSAFCLLTVMLTKSRTRLWQHASAPCAPRPRRSGRAQRPGQTQRPLAPARREGERQWGAVSGRSEEAAEAGPMDTNQAAQHSGAPSPVREASCFLLHTLYSVPWTGRNSRPASPCRRRQAASGGRCSSCPPLGRLQGRGMGGQQRLSTSINEGMEATNNRQEGRRRPSAPLWSRNWKLPIQPSDTLLSETSSILAWHSQRTKHD